MNLKIFCKRDLDVHSIFLLKTTSKEWRLTWIVLHEISSYFKVCSWVLCLASWVCYWWLLATFLGVCMYICMHGVEFRRILWAEFFLQTFYSFYGCTNGFFTISIVLILFEFKRFSKKNCKYTLNIFFWHQIMFVQWIFLQILIEIYYPRHAFQFHAFIICTLLDPRPWEYFFTHKNNNNDNKKVFLASIVAFCRFWESYVL